MNYKDELEYYNMLNRKRQQNKKRKNRIIVIAALGLLLAACGAPSGSVDGNPDGLENSDSGNGPNMGELPGEGDIGEEPQGFEEKEEPEEWSEEYYSCGVQELSGYLYEHTSVSVSPYASAEITIKD